MMDAADDAAIPLDLRFEAAHGRTILASRHVGYPFNVTAPLRPLGSRARVIVQSVSGGLFGGETLEQRIRVGCGAQAELRMPSATVVHATRDGAPARQRVRLLVETTSTLLYLPRPLILFPGSALAQSTDITVAEGATVLIREGFFAHDPEPEAGAGRSLCSAIRVSDAAGRRVAIDRTAFCGSELAAATPGVTGAFRGFGSVWLLRQMGARRHGALKDAVAAAFADDRDCYVSATALRRCRGAIVRIAAMDGGSLDMALDTVTALLAAFAGIG